MNDSRRLAALIAIGALEACGGSATPAGEGPNGSRASTQTMVTFSITVPPPSQTSARVHEYVSPNTQSIVVQQVDATPAHPPVGGPQIINVTPSSSGCSTSANGTVCTVSFPASPGTFDFSEKAYSATNGAGALLSENTLTSATIVAGQANTIHVTLNGVIGSLALPNSVSDTLDVPQTVSFNVLDPSGAQIIGPGTYDNGPLSVQAESTGVVSVSPSSFGSPGNASQISVQCHAAGTGTLIFSDAAGTITSLPYSCSANPITLQPGALDFDVTAANAADGTYDQVVQAVDSNTNIASYSPQLSCTPGVGQAPSAPVVSMTASPPQFNIRPLNPGTCTLSVTELFQNGNSEQSNTISIEVHTTSVGIQSTSRVR